MKIIATSDLHGNLPTIPECDLLLIAGDICPDFISRANQRAWFVDTFIPWIQAQPAKAYYATYGNHDWLPRPSVEWGDLTGNHFIKIDELVEHEGLKIWFTPWSNQFGHWAWMSDPDNLQAIYDFIPAGIDILVSHQPPYGYGDVATPRYMMGDGEEHLGSMELRCTIDRVQPDIVICGHIHGGNGIYRSGRTTIYNVALVDEGYRAINGVREIEL